jgi:hypothetical protein
MVDGYGYRPSRLAECASTRVLAVQKTIELRHAAHHLNFAKIRWLFIQDRSMNLCNWPRRDKQRRSTLNEMLSMKLSGSA